MGKAVTLTKGKSILIGGEHWVTVNQIDSHGKNVRLYEGLAVPFMVTRATASELPE